MNELVKLLDKILNDRHNEILQLQRTIDDTSTRIKQLQAQLTTRTQSLNNIVYEYPDISRNLDMQRECNQYFESL